MTDRQLEALAIYRNHKHCRCPDCETARKALVEWDSRQAGPADDLVEENGARVEEVGKAGRQ